jgi:hypothetical protein
VLGETHAVGRELVEVWGFDLGLAVAAQLPVPEVVGVDVDDVGLFVSEGGNGNQAQQQGREQTVDGLALDMTLLVVRDSSFFV